MNHTGVCGTGSRLHALRKAESYVAVGWGPEGLTMALTPKSLARRAGPFAPGPRGVRGARGTGPCGRARVREPYRRAFAHRDATVTSRTGVSPRAGAPFPLLFPAWLRLRDDCRTTLAGWATRRRGTGELWRRRRCPSERPSTR
ncbi:hypothetical protein GCM10010145_12410 [Streptomyces ruber]|uniref:Uncharacterized protein n=2 Tax=Streptomyces TaxID=1883 RepID=A0A918B8T5_9ACTN|nr:hypothetical protein GCM10010145_12410 [Streptomyces ruber]